MGPKKKVVAKESEATNVVIESIEAVPEKNRQQSQQQSQRSQRSEDVPPEVPVQPTVAKSKSSSSSSKVSSQPPPKVTKTSNSQKQEKKRKRKHNYNSFSIYIHKMFKQVIPSQKNKEKPVRYTMSAKSMSVMNSFVFDLFNRIATEASTLVKKKKKKTLGSSDLQVACRIVLTGELAKHAIMQGMTAVNKYSSQSE